MSHKSQLIIIITIFTKSTLTTGWWARKYFEILKNDWFKVCYLKIKNYAIKKCYDALYNIYNSNLLLNYLSNKHILLHKAF